MLEIVVNTLYMIGALVGSVYLSVLYNWSGFVFYIFLLLCFVLPKAAQEWLNRYERKGIFKYKKRRYEEAIAYFQKSYEYYGRHKGADGWRLWLWPFNRKRPGQESARAYLLQCYLHLGQRQKALECIRELKERWPKGIAGKADFSSLEVLEEGNYQEFQRKNEKAMVEALSVMLREHEKLELSFYGITSRRGKEGRSWKNRPCFIGMCGEDLLIVILKRPALEEVEWTERFPLNIKNVKRIKPRFPDWNIFELTCMNEDKVKLQFLTMLSANQYEGQRENVRRFVEVLSVYSPQDSYL